MPRVVCVCNVLLFQRQMKACNDPLRMSRKCMFIVEAVGWIPKCRSKHSSSSEDLNVLIKHLCAKGNVLEAFNTLKMVNVKDLSYKLDIYNSTLESLISSGNVEQAWQLFKQMKDEAPLNHVSYISLTRAFCNAGKIHDACACLEEMIQKGFTVDTNFLNSIITGFCKAEKWQSSLQILVKLCELGHIPQLVTFNILFGSLCRAGLVQQSCWLLDYMVKRKITPDVYTYSIMIHSLCKADKVEDASKLLRAMKKRNCVPDVVCYSTILHGYVRLGRKESAMKTVRDMHEQGCSLDVVAYNSLISMFSKQGDINNAFKMWNQMKESGVTPDQISYTAMLDGLCRQNKLRECLILVKEMLQSKLIIDAPMQRKLNECIERHGSDVEIDMVLAEIEHSGLNLGRTISVNC